ncbi:MAG: hypothetical protein Q4P24_02130 [Rhodobacterales bacterium]|nr:hypothetical protein [Rhodobacterales bacterium]
MEILILCGAAVSLLGVGGLVWCVVRVWRARRAKVDDAAMRSVLSKVVPVNTGALLLSFIGLMLVVLGIMLR